MGCLEEEAKGGSLNFSLHNLDFKENAKLGIKFANSVAWETFSFRLGGVLLPLVLTAMNLVTRNTQEQEM